MSQVILLNKPFHVLSQFTDREQPDNPRTTLADFLDAPSFRPAGRLDYDSEGLLVLTRDGKAQQRIAHPQHQQWKTYWVQVEGDIDDAIALERASAAAISAAFWCQPGVPVCASVLLSVTAAKPARDSLKRAMVAVFAQADSVATSATDPINLAFMSAARLRVVHAPPVGWICYLVAAIADRGGHWCRRQSRNGHSVCAADRKRIKLRTGGKTQRQHGRNTKFH